MVDKELLEAIRGVVREEVVEAEQRTTKNTVSLMGAVFAKKFDLLAEGIQDIQEKLVPASEWMSWRTK